MSEVFVILIAMNLEFVIFHVVGGLGIFLYGMKRLSDGLQNLAGARLRNIIRAFTSNHLKALLVGAGITSIVQSSSVTTVMLVGLLNAGVMTLKQSVGVVFGANIGTTITAQIIAFKISHYALPMIGLGLIMSTALRRKQAQFIGQVILSLGFIFLGLKFMKDAFAPLKHSQEVMEFCASLSVHPVLAILIGVILTVIVQSSSASIGITIVMASTGLIDFTAALYLLLGDNIGTTVTAWMASIGSCLSARRMALVHTMFNITGAIYFGFLVHSGLYTHFVDWLTPGAINTDTIARNIANAHTAFNIFNAIILFPAIGVMAWIATKVFSGEDRGFIGEAKFLDDRLLETPEIAIDQVVKEVHHMGDIAREAFDKACESYLNNDTKLVKEVQSLEKAVDSLQQDITKYLVKLFGHATGPDISNRLPSLLHSVNDIEKISDHAESISEMTLRRQDNKYPMSDMATKELREISSLTKSMFKETSELLLTGNLDLEKPIFSKEDQIDALKRSSIEGHIARLKSRECHPLAGLGFVAFINHTEKIADHLTNIASAAVHHFEYDSPKSN